MQYTKYDAERRPDAYSAWEFPISLTQASQSFEQTIFCRTAEQGGISHCSVGRNSASKRVPHHIRASFGMAKCNISPSQKERTVRCGGSIAPVMMLLFLWTHVIFDRRG